MFSITAKMCPKEGANNFPCTNFMSHLSQSAFVHGGTDTKFLLQDTEFVLQARSSGNKHDGIVHTLLANGVAVPEAKIQEIMQEPVSILQANWGHSTDRIAFCICWIFFSLGPHHPLRSPFLWIVNKSLKHFKKWQIRRGYCFLYNTLFVFRLYA